jgi:glycerophosphoryl diester phosphodiesterase
MHPFFKGYNFYGFVHRGGDEEKTENTLEAFQYSSDLGFVFMETDVQTTSDGKVVIFHDSDLKRVAGLNKKVSELTFKEIKKLDLIQGGRIPSLEETLSSFPSLRFNIDIKVDSAIEETIKVLKNHDALDRVCLAAFSTSRLNRIRKLTDSNLCSSMGQAEIVRLLLSSFGLNLKTSPGLCAQVPVAQFGIPIVTKRFIKKVHDLDKLVHVWTIDETKEMYRLIDLGVDGLMTDKPTVLKKALVTRNLF